MSNVQAQTPAEVTKLPVKAPKDVKGSGKAKKAAKAKKATKSTGRKLDKFGFVENKKRSKVAEMYARTEGASTSEVKRKYGHPHLNMLIALEERGKKEKSFPYTVDKKRKPNKAGKDVTRYYIVLKTKSKDFNKKAA